MRAVIAFGLLKYALLSSSDELRMTLALYGLYQCFAGAVGWRARQNAVTGKAARRGVVLYYLMLINVVVEQVVNH